MWDWITFDCYGTLIDWETGARGYLSRLMKRHGLTRDLDTVTRRWEQLQLEYCAPPYRPYRDVLAQSAWALMRELTVWIAPSDAADFADSMKTWKPFEETAPALTAAKESARLGIISNTDPDILEASVKLIGVEFDALVTAADARAYKPDKAVFETAIEKIGGDPDRWLHVAFGFNYDLNPAREVGLKTAWVNRNGIARPPGVRADYEIRSLAELATVGSR